MYDVIVIGAGPAGLAAAMQTLRQQLRTLLIAPDLAGKASYRLYLPWMQERETIMGEEAVEQLRQYVISDRHATRYLDEVEHVFQHGERFHVVTTEGGVFIAQAVIVASGLRPLHLGVLGEQRLMGYGVSYSAISHVHLFADRRVVVIGRDQRALHSVALLSAIAQHVTLIVPEAADLSQGFLGRQLLSASRVTVLEQCQVLEITGDAAVTGVLVALPDGRTEHVLADGVFIELGLVAPTDFLSGLVERTPEGRIVVDAEYATRTPGLFAAGDVTGTAFAEQSMIAIGEGAKCGLSAARYLRETLFVLPTANV